MMFGKNKEKDKASWAIGGGLLFGLGVGLLLLETYSGLAFVGSLLAGLGIGLIITSIISTK